MGLLDYYRQFEGMTEEEVNAGLRAEAAERKRRALMRVDTLDLSQTTWPELPDPSIVNAITFVARRGMHRYPHLRGSQLHQELSERHGVEPERIILGNGAAELLSSAARALIEPGQRLLSPWPSYPLFPIMGRRAHGRPVPVSTSGKTGETSVVAADAAADVGALDVDANVAPDGSDPDAGVSGGPVSGQASGRQVSGRQVSGMVDLLLSAASEPGTRIIAIATPNDPTGELLPTAELERLLAGLPGDVAVLLDESLVEFADAQPVDSSLRLLGEHPRLFVFRSFSKAWGLAGLRVGYAIGGPGSEELLAELAPDLGVSEVSQAGALEALRSCSELVAHRVQTVSHERTVVTEGLRERGFEVTDSQANFVWAAHPSLDGAELSARLARAGVLIAAGAPLGEPRHVRIALRDSAATTRLLDAVDKSS